jgi:hypothetical protein
MWSLRCMGTTPAATIYFCCIGLQVLFVSRLCGQGLSDVMKWLAAAAAAAAAAAVAASRRQRRR